MFNLFFFMISCIKLYLYVFVSFVSVNKIKNIDLGCPNTRFNITMLFGCFCLKSNARGVGSNESGSIDQVCEKVAIDLRLDGGLPADRLYPRN